MHYSNVCSGIFLFRINRFMARVLIQNREETVHVRNTGRLGELLIPGAVIQLNAAASPKRKTAWDLVAVWKEGLGWVNIDSQACNIVVREWLSGEQSFFPGLKRIEQEWTYGHSRIDFSLETTEGRILLEVKGCTLEKDGIGYFPDAPTQRGIKHLNELCRARQEGYEAVLAYVIAMPGVTRVLANSETQPEYGAAAQKALKEGVRLLYCPCEVLSDGFSIKKEAVWFEG